MSKSFRKWSKMRSLPQKMFQMSFFGKNKITHTGEQNRGPLETANTLAYLSFL